MGNGQLSYPKKLYLDDGTEIRLVPIERTGRPLYVTKDGRGYSLIRNGRIRRIKPFFAGRNHNHPTKIPYLNFCHFNHISVHHSVLLAWGSPRPEGYQCDHINGNYLDNRLENLEWVTRAENMRRRWDLNSSRGLSWKGKKLTELDNDALRHHGKHRKKGKLVQLTINFESL